MNGREKVGLALIVLLVLAGAVGAVFYVQEREDRLRAQLETQAIERVVKARDEVRQERDQKADAEIADLRKHAATVRTVTQAVAELPQVAKLPAPILEEKGATPDAPSRFIIPQESIVPLYQQLAKCQVDAVDLDRCHADAKDDAATRKDVEKERDKWKAAANGGTKMLRFKRGMKWLGIGIVVGGGLVLAAKR
jgi:hypothetical protein